MLKKKNHFVWDSIVFNFYTFELTHFMTKPTGKASKYYYLYKYLHLRFEKFWYHNVIFNNKQKLMEYLFYYVEKFLFNFKAEIIKLSKRQTIFIYLKFISNSYQGYRHFLRLPVRGQRTWSNRKSNLKKKNLFFNFYKNIFFKKRGSYCPESKKSAIIYAEFVNKFYFLQYFKYYNDVRNRRFDFIQDNLYKRWRYDIRSILANRVYTYLTKVEKLKKNKKRKQRKKVKIPNNYFNIGFNLGFTERLTMTVLKHFHHDPIHTVKKKKKKKKK